MSQKLLLCLMENDYSRLVAAREDLTKCVCPESAFLGGDGIYIR